MSNYDAAIKEAYASVGNIPILETLELHHEDKEPKYLVNSKNAFTAFLEDGVTEIEFRPVGFRMALPKKDYEGVTQLSIEVDDIENEASDYVKDIIHSQKHLTAIYRPYKANDPSGPRMNPPLRLKVKTVTTTDYTVSAQATFGDYRNRKAPNENYTRSRFPGLGG